MAELENDCGCPGLNPEQMHTETGLYLSGQGFCGNILTMGCEPGVVNPIGYEEFAGKIGCYLDKCCNFFDLNDTPGAGDCPERSIFYSYQDSVTEKWEVRCTDICTLLQEEVNSGCQNPWGDRLVGATATDSNPGALIDKLQNNGCITWSVSNPGTSNEKIEANCNLEYNLIDTLDGPLSWPTCPQGNGNIVQNGQNGWKVVCPECREVGTTRLTISEQYPLLSGMDGFIMLGGAWDGDYTECSVLSSLASDNGSNITTSNVGGIFRPQRTGFYDLDFGVLMKWSHGIRTLRVQLVKLNGGGEIITEGSIEGPDFETTDFENSYNPTSQVQAPNVFFGNINRGISRMYFNGSRRFLLNAGDSIGILIKYSTTDVPEDETHFDNPNISIQGRDDTVVTGGKAPGAYISRAFEPLSYYPVL